jgi:hypothetical protein
MTNPSALSARHFNDWFSPSWMILYSGSHERSSTVALDRGHFQCAINNLIYIATADRRVAAGMIVQECGTRRQIRLVVPLFVAHRS